jgi:hypothetical protein
MVERADVDQSITDADRTRFFTASNKFRSSEIIGAAEVDCWIKALEALRQSDACKAADSNDQNFH